MAHTVQGIHGAHHIGCRADEGERKDMADIKYCNLTSIYFGSWKFHLAPKCFGLGADGPEPCGMEPPGPLHQRNKNHPGRTKPEKNMTNQPSHGLKLRSVLMWMLPGNVEQERPTLMERVRKPKETEASRHCLSLRERSREKDEHDATEHIPSHVYLQTCVHFF